MNTNIIHAIGQSVNSEDEELSSKIGRWTKHKTQSVFVSKHMIRDYRENIRKRGFLMKNCGDKLIYERIGDTYKLREAWLCRDRLCPICQWRLSLQRVSEMQQTLALLPDFVPESKAIHVVLTVKNCTLPLLRDTIKQISEGFTKLKKRKLFRDYVAGYCRSIEITKSDLTELYHPHIHCICIVPQWYTRQISVGDWSEMWRDSCQLNYNPIVWAEHAYVPTASPTEAVFNDYRSDEATMAILEAIKYCLKPESLETATKAGDIGDLAEAVKGVRMVSYGGAIKKARSLIGADDEDKPQIPECTLELSSDGFDDRYLVCYRWAWETQKYFREK